MVNTKYSFKDMGFWKSFFGAGDETPEEEKKNAEAKNFDLLKYDGVKAMRMGQFAYAEKCFREALKIQDDLEVHDYLSQTLVRLGNMEGALAELKTIVRAAPDNVAVLLQGAQVAYMQEDYDQMREFCEKALEIEKDNARVHFFYAQSSIGKDDQIGAVAWLTKAIALDERMGDARLLRGQTLLKMGNVVGALEDVKWLMENVQPQEDVLLLAARAVHQQGNDDLAITLYDQIVEMNPFQFDAYRERGKIKFDRGDKQGAEEDMQKLLELNPDEMADVSGEYSAEGVEQAVKRAYSSMNPFGI